MSSTKFGVSFSLHRCYELRLDPKKVLNSAIKELGFRRFRLMSYWNIHEPKQGVYDFRQLDWQMDLLAKHGCSASLCLGKRQPRWPECHIPEWALALPKNAWQQTLLDYIKVVVRRYKDHPALESWQLENEALLKSFGYCPDGDYSRERLNHEFKLIKSLDTQHPVIMALSDSWGMPWLAPKPDIYAMSIYRNTINKKGRYSMSRRDPGFYHIRALLIRLLKNRITFVHELQAEPWLESPITEFTVEKQLSRFSSANLQEIIKYARKTRMSPIDLWGLEWWYWLREKHGNNSLWDAARELIRKPENE